MVAAPANPAAPAVPDVPVPKAYSVLAADVSAETFMEQFAALGCELVDGEVRKVAAIHLRHELLRDYLRDLLRAYCSVTGRGRVLGEPFVMLLPAFPQRRREPDLMVLLPENPAQLLPTYLSGPADIVIEIVSPASTVTDYGEKFIEYETGGVREYWIIDPERRNLLIYRLGAEGVYLPCPLIDGVGYATPLLPGLRLHIPTLWQETLPDLLHTVEAVRQMLNENASQP